MTLLFQRFTSTISIHILHAEDDYMGVLEHDGHYISIHILHAEDDMVRQGLQKMTIPISIHILHAEDDGFASTIILRKL